MFRCYSTVCELLLNFYLREFVTKATSRFRGAAGPQRDQRYDTHYDRQRAGVHASMFVLYREELTKRDLDPDPWRAVSVSRGPFGRLRCYRSMPSLLVVQLSLANTPRTPVPGSWDYG